MKKSFLVLFILLCASALLYGCSNESVTELSEHEHTFSSEYLYNDKGHWLYATCGHPEVKTDYGHHTFDEKNVCRVCKYERTNFVYSLNEDGDSYSVSYVGSREITEITIPNHYNGLPVTKIAAKTLYGCDMLKSITIPFVGESIDGGGNTSIMYLFDGVLPSNLKTVTIMEGAKTIGNKAFKNCDSIREINLPNSITSIGAEAFSDCTNPMDIVLPDSITEIGDKAFFNCKYVSFSKLPESLTKIGESAFSNCLSLESLALPKGLTTIGDQAFANCKNLKNITIPETVTSLGSSAFAGCESLETIDLANVSEVQESTFLNCSSLKEISFGKGVKSIGDAFGGCEKLEKIDIYTSTIISKDTFSNCWAIDKVNITQLGSDKAGSIYKAISESIPNNNLFDVTVTGSSIENDGFKECFNLKSIILNDGITSIGNEAFSSCPNLEKIVIPDSVTKIGEKAFSLTALKEIVIPNGVESIETNTFEGCRDLTKVTILNSVKSIGNDAFFECSSLASVTIPDSVTSIGIRAFYACNALKNITIPSSVKIIGDYAFYIDGLENIYYDGAIKDWCTISFDTKSSNPSSYAQKLLFKNNDEWFEPNELIIPEGIRKLGSYLFAGFDKVSKIVISNGIVNIGEGCFSECTQLTDISIPNSVTKIGAGILSGCNNLEKVTIPFIGEKDSDEKSTFDYFYSKSGGEAISNIKEVVVSRGIINNFAFSKCSNLHKIELGSGVTRISGKPFTNCGELNILVFKCENVKIDTEAFKNCKKLIEIYNLSDYQLKKGSTNFGSIAYNAITIRTSLDEKFEYINSGEFKFFYDGEKYYLLDYYGDSSKLVLPESINDHNYSIYSYAFENNGKFTDITIPKEVEGMYDFAFYDCSNLDNVYYDGSIEDWCNINFMTINSNPMSSAKKIFFKSNDEWVEPKELIIPNTVKTIKQIQFYGMHSLEEIVIPSTVESIEIGAFNSCDSVKKITIPSSLFSTDDNQFNTYFNLSDFDLVITGESNIGRNAFIMADIRNITIPSTIKTIEKDAFAGCSKLESVYYEGSIEDWCNISFMSPNSNPMYYARNFYMKDGNDSWIMPKEIIIPNTITKISDYQFINFKNLVNVTISEGVKEIGKMPFYACDKLYSISIPSTVERIGEEAFWSCEKLVEIYNLSSLEIKKEDSSNGYVGYYAKLIHTFPTVSHVITVDDKYVFVYDNEINYYLIDYIGSEAQPTLPETIDGHTYEITKFAFKDNDVITEVAIPNGIIDIDEYAFYSCDNLKFNEYDNAYYLGNEYNPYLVLMKSKSSTITSCMINDYTRIICENAFLDNYNLHSIVIPSEIFKIGGNAFWGCVKLAEIYNLSPLEITKEDLSNGYVGYYARVIHTSLVDSHIITTDDKYVFVYDNDNNYYLIDYTGGEAQPTLPENINENYYTIASCAFFKNDVITKVNIPNTIISVENGAFSLCDNLIFNEYDNAYYLGNNDNQYLVLMKLKSEIITKLIIHKNVKFIVPCNASDETEVFYEDSEEDAQDIINNGAIYRAEYYYLETMPTVPGNYWHYVDGVVTKW